MNKRKHVYLLAVALIFSVVATAQDTTLQRIMAAKDDSAKVVQLAAYADLFTDTDTTKALDVYTELMRLSQKLDYPYWKGMVWMNRAYMKARAALDEQAVSHYTTALSFLSRTDRVDKVALCHLNISAVSERLGRVDERVRHLTRAITLLENTQYKMLLNHAYNSMGVLFYNQDEYNKGAHYFRKALQAAPAINDTVNQVAALHGLTNCLSAQKRFEEASSYGQKLLALATAAGDKESLIHAHTSLCGLYNDWQKAAPTLAHARQVLNYATASGNVPYQLVGLMGMAQGYGLSKDPANSVAYYQKALQLDQEKGVVIQLDDIYKGLSENYEQLGQPQKALDCYRKYIQYRDSASNAKVKKMAAELDAKYKAAQKEKALSENRLQLAQKSLQLRTNRYYMYFSLAALIMAVLVAALIYGQSRHKKLAHQRELRSLQQQKELHLLYALMQGEERERSRIAKDLHDGVAGMLAAVKMHFSSMPAADYLSGEEGYRQGMYLLNEAAQEIRKTSHNLMPEVLLQHGLDEALRRYCHSAHNSRTLQIQYDSWGQIDRFSDSFELSVYRIVQELVNNIIKHSRATQAIVQVSQQQKVLSISIEDNGVGFVGEYTGDGMGLHSLQSRVQAMNGKLEVLSGEQSGVSAYLEFDIAELKKETTALYE